MDKEQERQEREQRGLQIAATAKLEKTGDGRWFVPSQSHKAGFGGTGYYAVNPEPVKPNCTCPDYQHRQDRCKHIFAVEYTIQREETSDGETVVTETLKISRRTYSQDWRSYNRAQTEEKDYFQKLLYNLCQGIGEPSAGIKENDRQSKSNRPRN